MLQPRWRRWYWRRRGVEASLEKLWVAPPAARTNWRDADLLVCDAEMSSLDSKEGELLSLGWVALDSGRIQLASASHLLLKAKTSVGHSAVIHQLRDCELVDGLSAPEAMQQFFDAARGRVLVFHNASLDVAYLNKLCVQHYSAPLCMPYLCTLRMEQQRLLRRDHPIAPADLMLAHCRSRYGLPAYTAHNALCDALATAELLLAQASHWGREQGISLGQLGLRYS